MSTRRLPSQPSCSLGSSPGSTPLWSSFPATRIASALDTAQAFSTRVEDSTVSIGFQELGGFAYLDKLNEEPATEAQKAVVADAVEARKAATEARIAEDGFSVHEVTHIAEAQAALEVLRSLPADFVHACDTEVDGLDLSKSPLGQGEVICFSVYSGPDVDYGSGAGAALWVDTTVPEVLEVFKPWLQDKSVLKAWHNYAFDRHVLYNHGVDVKGFAGDTMHMARLWDASRLEGYSLEVLTSELVGQRKVPMKELFGVRQKKKDGTPGLKVVLPSMMSLQTSAGSRDDWVRYSARDSYGTWKLYMELKRRLEEMPWQQGQTLFKFYLDYWNPFGELLTDLERNGVKVDVTEHLPRCQRAAEIERDRCELRFRRWASSYCEDAWFINPASALQIRTLLYGGCRNTKTSEVLPATKVYKIDRKDYDLLKAARDGVDREEEIPYTLHKGSVEKTAAPRHAAGLPSLPALVQGAASKLSGSSSELQLELADLDEEQAPAAAPGKAPKPLRSVEFEIRSLELEFTKMTASGWPSTAGDTLKEMAGQPYESPPVWGSAYEAFGGGDIGREACEALHALQQVGTIEKMLSSFILPLQENADSQSRVHCSLNLNTETGRLSARRPNLQNQPALEKDQYKIRKAFTAEDGNALVVADYGQLELRLLAHITNCKSMVSAFKEGGCFHSRTAMGMFQHVREAVERGDCLLEWDYSKGDPPAPLLKDVFGSERRRAKTLNFSIAYGKTAHGLSKDWGVSIDEAKEMVRKWYDDRPEVRDWQAERIQYAHETGAIRTLMGRYRRLGGINSRSGLHRGHAERAAINTPIQGGAADVMTLAMLKISRSPVLERLGYRMLLQIHDEVILEGPAEDAEEAKAEVVACMENPFDEALPSLLVDLAVDAKTAFTWFDAK